MNKAFRKLAAVAAGCVLVVGFGAGSASAIDIGFYFLPGGAVGTAVTPPVGTTNYQLWVDDTNAVGGAALGIADIKIVSGGVLSMNTWAPNATNTGPSSLSGTTLNIATALGINPTAAAFELGTINVVNAGGFGDITLFSGDYLSAGSTQVTMTLPQTIAAAIPEPGTLLLFGAGMAGLGVLIRRNRS